MHVGRTNPEGLKDLDIYKKNSCSDITSHYGILLISDQQEIGKVLIRRHVLMNPS